jgi:hypothetical protein
MAKHHQRQALAVSSRLSPTVLPGYTAGDIASLEANAAKIMADHEGRISNGQGASGHIVIDSGKLSGFVRDAHTTVRFAGGSVAVTTHD